MFTLMFQFHFVISSYWIAHALPFNRHQWYRALYVLVGCGRRIWEGEVVKRRQEAGSFIVEQGLESFGSCKFWPPSDGDV